MIYKVLEDSPSHIISLYNQPMYLKLCFKNGNSGIPYEIELKYLELNWLINIREAFYQTDSISMKLQIINMKWIPSSWLY